MVSLSYGLFEEGLPMLSFWQTLTNTKTPLVIKEDNEATIKIINKGFSPKLRSLTRTHRVNLGAIHEMIQKDDIKLEYIETDKQAADIFTKCLDPNKWSAALALLGMKEFPSHNPS